MYHLERDLNSVWMWSSVFREYLRGLSEMDERVYKIEREGEVRTSASSRMELRANSQIAYSLQLDGVKRETR